MITSVFISLSLCSNIFSLFQCYVTSELFVSAIYSIPPASFPWHCQEDINLTENKKPSYCLSFTIIYILIINPQILLRAPCHKHYKWFWVLWKLLLVSYCIVVWVLCGVFLCFCITSLILVIAPVPYTKRLPKTTKEGLELKKKHLDDLFYLWKLIIKNCSSVPIVILLTFRTYKLLILFSILTYLGIGKVIVYFHSSSSCFYSWASKCSLDFPQW